MAAGPLPCVHKVYVAPGGSGTQRAEQMENIALTNAESWPISSSAKASR